jgi:hypothetical protein
MEMKREMEEGKRKNLSRVVAPPVMDEDQREDLRKVFIYLDKDCGGTISVDELVGAQFMDLEEATRKATEYCGVGGEFTFEVFCEMMCPHGWRYKEHSGTAYENEYDGGMVALDETDGQWYRVALPQKQKGFLKSLYPERTEGADGDAGAA